MPRLKVVLIDMDSDGFFTPCTNGPREELDSLLANEIQVVTFVSTDETKVSSMWIVISTMLNPGFDFNNRLVKRSKTGHYYCLDVTRSKNQ